MNQSCYKLFFVFFLLLNLAGTGPLLAQANHGELITQLEDKDLRKRVGAIRALALAVVRRSATEDQRALTIESLKRSCENQHPVVRLTAHVELLKIAAAENDVELSRIAIQSCNDDDINVRRETMKFVRSFYSGRYEAGKMHEAVLLEKVDDLDLETRFHAAGTLHSWGVSNEKIVNTMIDSLGLNNYRASSLYSLIHNEKDRGRLINMLMQRLETSKINASIHVNAVAMLTPESRSQTSQLLKYYDSESVAVRAAVIDAIGRLQSARDESFAVLQRATEDDSPVIRRLVITALIRLEPDKSQVKEVMLKLLHDKDERVCLSAADAFSWFQDDFEAIRADISAALSSGERNPVSAALNGCLSCGPMSADLGPEVAQLLKDGNTETRILSCWALGEMEVDRKIFLDAAEHALNKEPDLKSLTAIMDSMSRFATPGDDCQKLFLKYLEHESPNIRLSCCIGLKNYPDVERIERVIRLPRDDGQRATAEMLNIDRAAVDFLVATGDAGAPFIVPFLKHEQPHVRARAIRALAQRPIEDESVKEQMFQALQDEDDFVRTSAAYAVTRAPQLDMETLEAVFNVSDANRRQQTVGILELFGTLGEKASPITPRIAFLMNGGFQNRYSIDAMNTLIKLGEHAAPATASLLAEPFNLRKIECIAAIGPKAKQAEAKLRQTISGMEARIAVATQQRRRTMLRRTRLGAAIALWRVSGDEGPASVVLNEELDGEFRDMALTALHSFKPVDQATLNKVIAMLPDQTAINALGQLGEPATPAVDSLLKAVGNENDSISFDASRALWNITRDPQFAIAVVQKILDRNRFSLVDIRVEDRQQMWEALSFLNTLEDPAARQQLDKIQAGRFSSLRTYVRQLRESGSAS